MSERKLVTLKEITDIQPIEGADKIEVASIGGWKVVVKKDEYYIGQRVFYAEVDSMLPLDRGYFAFLRDRGVKVQDGKEYHRLKTAKLRGQISQGIIFPHSIIQANPKARWDENGYPISKDLDGNDCSPYLDPDDVCDKELDIFENHEGDFSEYFGVVKYDPPMPEELRGKCKPWPSFIEKTDEERIQNLPGLLDELDPDDWYATEKIDGTSTTLFMKRDEESNLKKGVCSRNYELEEVEGNLYWRLAKSSGLFDVMEQYMSKNPETKVLAFQGESFGVGIQGNPLGMKDQKILLYTIQKDGVRLSKDEIWTDPILHKLTSEDYWVPTHNVSLVKDLDAMIKMPDGIKTQVPLANKDAQIEGFVWRSYTKSEIKYNDEIIKGSFKCVSNKYLLKHDG